MIKAFTSIKKIENIWKELCLSNNELSFYQQYAWNKNLFSRYKLLRADKASYKVVFYVLFNDKNSARIIAPLTIPVKTNEPVMIFGGYTKQGILNFVYTNDCSFEEFDEICSFICEKYKGQKLAFREIPRNSMFGKYLNNNIRFQLFFSRGSVRCVVPKTSDQLLSALSKSVRQTIRTSYNRLKKNDIETKLEVHHGYKFTLQEKKTLNKLHLNRKKAWGLNIENENANGLKKIKQFLRDTLIDPFFMFAKNKSFMYVKYYINDEIAAFFFGMIYPNNYCIVPTLIHNTNYRQYNPGLLMIYEYLNEQTKSNEMEFFDLSRGIDDYKLRYLPNPEIYYQEQFVCDNES